MNDLRGLAEEANVVVDAALSKTVQCQHSRIAQNLGQLVQHFVRDQQDVIRLDDPEEQIAGKPFGAVMSSNEDCGVEGDSH